MFCCQVNFNKPTEVIGRERFWALVRAPRTARLVAEARAAHEKGDTVTYDKKKKGLPLMVFTGTFEEWDKEIENKTTKERRTERGMWRNQSHVFLNGLAVADYDHLEGDVRQLWAEAYARLADEDKARVLLAYVTPSGQGLKVVFAADPDAGNLIDNITDFSARLGLQADESGKDASRGSFITTEQDILLIDETHLFTYENGDFKERYETLYREGNSQSTKGMTDTTDSRFASLRGGTTKQTCQEATSLDCFVPRNDGTDSPLSSGRGDGGEGLFRDPNLTYHDVPYFKIVDAWLNGAVIKPGDRHRTSLRLADHLRYITDNDPVLMETILRQTPFVDEIVKERNEDVAGTVESAREYKMYRNIPQRMREALVKCGIMNAEMQSIRQSQCGIKNAELRMRNAEFEEKPGDASRYSEFRIQHSELKTDIYAALPFDEWARDLAELSDYYPCMKALFVNLHPYKTPAALFSAAAMLGTLMTRTWYHFWYDPQTARRLNYSIFVIGDPGAGKSVVGKFYDKLCDPMLQADQVGIDAINRYKEGRTERSTSTKAQKGDALKKPSVGIRVHPARTANGEFIRHMLAAVEQVQGRTLHLHMFSFDAELDNVTKQSKGGEYKDRESLELKAFHNENDGQFYANYESVTANFNVYWNFVYTGTPYALSRKVNQRNFGTGLSTRLAVIPLPNKGIAERHQKVDPAYDEELTTWAYRLDKVEGELPIEPLNDETYDWQSARLEIAEFNEDKAEKLLLMRIPYYGINVSLPFILMRHWDEWQESKTLTIDDTDKRLCRLAMEIQYRCQHFFFGEMAYNYFEDQGKEFVQRRRTSRYDECFRKLPDEFKTEQFMECFGVSQSAASRSITRLQEDGYIKKVKYGLYKKVVQALMHL